MALGLFGRGVPVSELSGLNFGSCSNLLSKLTFSSTLNTKQTFITAIITSMPYCKVTITLRLSYFTVQQLGVENKHYYLSMPSSTVRLRALRRGLIVLGDGTATVDCNI